MSAMKVVLQLKVVLVVVRAVVRSLEKSHNLESVLEVGSGLRATVTRSAVRRLARLILVLHLDMVMTMCPQCFCVAELDLNVVELLLRVVVRPTAARTVLRAGARTAFVDVCTQQSASVFKFLESLQGWTASLRSSVRST